MFQMALTYETLMCNFDNLVNFVRYAVAEFDESHDLNHAISVTLNSHKIMTSFGESFDSKLLIYMAMLHDVCDHKYPNSISKEELEEFIKNNLGENQTKYVMYIVNNLSWSKESQGKREPCEKWMQNYLIAIGDADRLEAIGYIGIKRCFIFGKAKYPYMTDNEAIQRVIEHCDEKLLRIYPEYFIVSNYARIIAEPLHKETIKFRENPTLL